MHAFTTGLAAARRRSGSGLFYLVVSGLLWGTGGLTGSLLGRAAGLSAIAVAAYRLTAGGLLIVAFRALAGPVLARRAGGLDPDRRNRPAGRALPELLLHGRVADLGAAGHADHDRRRAGHRARRGPGDRAASQARGRQHRPGRDRAGAARGPALRVRRNRRPGQRGHGRAGRGGVRRGYPDRFPPGAWSRRSHRDRFRLHHRRPGPDAARSASGRHRLPAVPRVRRPAGRAGHRPHRRGLYALLPRPAVRRPEHGRLAGPARAADRRHPGGPAARRAAQRDRDRRGGRNRHGRHRHRAGEPRRCGPWNWPRWRRRWRRCSARTARAPAGPGRPGPRARPAPGGRS